MAEDALAAELVRRLTARSLTVVGAESCTAGLGAASIARIPGASRVLWGGYVTYTADAKMRMLGVPAKTIEQYGVVSRETACAMAEGALDRSGADLAFSVTGLAGPEGDASGLPVGTVWIATAARGEGARASAFNFSGSRNEVRLAAAAAALEELLKGLKI